MARRFTSGFEVANDTAGHEWANAGVSGAGRTTAVFRSGVASGRVTGLVSATPAGWAVQIDDALVNGPFYKRFYLRVDTAPSADNTICAFIAGANVTSTSVNDAQLRLTSTGTLRLFANNAAVGSASSALTLTDFENLVEIEVDNTPASGSKIIRAYLNGSQFAGVTNSANVGGTINGIAVGGNLGAEAQTTGDWYFDDVALNDDSGSAQNGLPGPGNVIVIRPSATGDSNQFNNTANGAGGVNNWNLVDETSPDDATTMVQSGTLNNLDLYNLDNSGIGASDDISVVHVHLRRRNNVADATTAVNTVVVKTSGGTQATGIVTVPNTTTWRTGSNTVTTGVVAPSFTAYVDPDGAAWTQATIDSMQAGPKITTANVNRIQVSALWVTVDYVPVTAVNADAEAATATGSASDASTSVTATADAASGTGTADAPTASVAAPAEAAAGTGTATDATVSTVPATEANAQAATGTGSAGNPSTAVTVNAEAATGTGTAPDGTAADAPAAEAATGTGSAGDPSTAVTVNAEPATGTGSALDATVSTASITNAPADVATGTGTAADPSASITTNAQAATGSGAADAPTGAPAGNAESASGTGAALDASTALTVFAEPATGSGTAPDPLGGPSNLADVSSGTGTAADASVAIEVNAESATGSGTAWDPTAIGATPGDASAEVATGSGVAYDARTRKLYVRPFTGTTARPAAGTTLRPAGGTTTRPLTGVTVRPSSGTTLRP